MARYVGICPHTAGMFPADHEEVEAASIPDAVQKVRMQMFPGRYVSRVMGHIDGRWVDVWTEAKGTVWNEATNSPITEEKSCA